MGLVFIYHPLEN